MTTTGDLIAASAANTPTRLAAVASGQVLSSQGVGALPAWAAASAGALTRVGGNTTEATTTSTTEVSLLAVASLSIAALSPIYVLVSIRKTSGAAAAAKFGFRLNASQMFSTAYTCTSAVNAAEDGHLIFYSSPRQTNYTKGGYALKGTPALTPALVAPDGNAMPIIPITDIALYGLVGDAAVTMGADELHIYTYAIS